MDHQALAYRRREHGRVVAGVAGGFADQHGVDAIVVRGALIVLAFAGGIGFVAYAVLALLADARAPLAAATPAARRNASVACVAMGLALVVRSSGIWLGDSVMAQLIVIVVGVVLLGVVGDAATQRTMSTPFASAVRLMTGRHARVRVVAGSALIAVGLLAVGLGGQLSTGVRTGVIATAASILGVAVLIGPWLARLAQQAADERRQRIRSEERAAMAEHLHDSVLQTLALIQRSADDPRRTITLARQQEHELRSWLYGDRTDQARNLVRAIDEIVAEVESRYDVRIDRVVVGDHEMTEGLDALCGALREACVNAAKHSGVADIAAYVEVGSAVVEAFVRDRGRGFDRTTLAADRRGITQSIEARLDRVGGTAAVESISGHGTEVHLSAPIRARAPL